jgi:hypothetical protein
VLSYVCTLFPLSHFSWGLGKRWSPWLMVIIVTVWHTRVCVCVCIYTNKHTHTHISCCNDALQLTQETMLTCLVADTIKVQQLQIYCTNWQAVSHTAKSQVTLLRLVYHDKLASSGNKPCIIQLWVENTQLLPKPPTSSLMLAAMRTDNCPVLPFWQCIFIEICPYKLLNLHEALLN